MAQQLSPVHPVKGVKEIGVFDDGSLRCVVVNLIGGGLCLYNPVKGLNAESVRHLQEIGPIKYLLTPNHYHHRALLEYSNCFSKAKICGSAAANPRLQKQTRLDFAGLAGLKRLLPAAVTVVEPKGLKTGEVWLRIKQGSEVCWLVGDAFCGPEQAKPGSFSANPGLLKTFPSFGVGSQPQYVEWISSQLDADMPTTVVPCHGGTLRSKRLPHKLRQLVSDYIG